MTIKQFIELEKIKQVFNEKTGEYLLKHKGNLDKIAIIENSFLEIKNQLDKLTKYFYEQ
jgi:hypothetical protein